MALEIVRDLHTEGPAAWLKYFTHSDNFFMASDGELSFANFDSASFFVHNFATTIKRVDLTWSDMRIDSLSPELATMAASFHEVMYNVTGIQNTPAGYFTGTVERTASGWKLRNAHWSSLHREH